MRCGLLAAAVALAMFGMGGTAAAQSPPTGISVVDGKTAAGLRLRPGDPGARVHPERPGRGPRRRRGPHGDRDHAPEGVRADLKVPAIVAPSPYYTADCGQFVGECIGDLDADGVNDRWPLWYDNFFVPRGYAVILAEMDGTANSTGCATNGGPSDVLSIKVVVDWLNGRVPGYSTVTATTNPIVPNWHTGKAAMIGRSYNGTLPNGVGGDGRRGADDDRPDLGDLVLVRLLADGRRDRLDALPGVPVQLRHRREPASRLRARPRRDEPGRRRCRRHDERVLGRAQLPPERRQGQGLGVRDALPAGRQRQARPVLRVVVRPGGQQRAAQAVAVPRGSHRPVHDAPRGVDEPVAPVVRLLALGRAERHHGPAARRHREHEGQLAGLSRLAAAGLRGGQRVPAGRHAGDARQARRRLGRRDRHAALDGSRQPERGHRAEHRGDHDAEQPPRLPLARR